MTRSAEVEYLDGGLVGLMGTAEQSANAGDELARRERLNQIVVGAELKTDNTVLDLALSRQHDDGDIRGIANGAANALAGDLGEHKVEHDQVELMLLELLDRGLAIADAHQPSSLRARDRQRRRHGLPSHPRPAESFLHLKP